nr:DUF1971 domain-containing protein [Sphingomonas sp. BK235]
MNESASEKVTVPVRGRAARAGPLPYRSSPVFDETTLPLALCRDHRIKAGVWAVIRVLDGQLIYREASGEAILLTPDRRGLIEPERPHHVEVVGPVTLQIDFYDRRPEPTS